MNYDVKDFEKEVIQLSSSIPVMVDFWAEWCGPCRVLSPILEKLAVKHNKEWELKKLNTEEFPDIAARYEIRSIPNVKLFFEGSVANEFAGALPESSIEQWLRTALPDKYARQLDQAELLVRSQRFEDARNLMEPILKESPDHERARALLAAALLFSDRARAIQLVAQIDESSKQANVVDTVRTFNRLISKLDDTSTLPESHVKANYLAAIKSLSERRFDNALELFIRVIREDRYYDEDGSRNACIAIFNYLGEESEITMKHRREFGNALYV
jgi:putative thioredoxin